ICQFGASTGMLADNIIQAAKDRSIEAVVNAYSISDAKDVVGNADIVLLGPQLRFQQKKIEQMVNGEIPVMVIEPFDYGMVNGEAVLTAALNKIKK
ncbi:MAG: PTS sugar transporter subunit IIB, partial [Erysipelotrichaceae bacterium]|nr:PTS sugar transporter subunit IIB [Erysipelotrichaceae bacterium]